jgi:hypothetical protein
MKIQIWDKAESVDKVLRLRLVREGYCVSLQAVNEDGDLVCKGRLLVILDDGTLQLSTNVSDDLGLVLDKDGRIEVMR